MQYSHFSVIQVPDDSNIVYSNLIYADVLLGKNVSGKLHGHIVGVELFPPRNLLVIPVERVEVHRHHRVRNSVVFVWLSEF